MEQGTQPAVKSKGVKFWRQQVDLALSARKPHEVWWDANLKAYAPTAGSDPNNYACNINTNRDFTLVERKKADLFYQSPEVTLTPTPLMDQPITMGPVDPNTGQPAAVPASQAISAHQQIVNEKLSEDGIDAAEMMDAVVFDILEFGVGCTKMGYESVTVEVEQIDPMSAADPMVQMGLAQPKTVKVPVPIYEKCFWHHFSLKQFLKPHDFRSTEWDRAPWLGYQFELPLTAANRKKYRLPADFKGSAPKERLHFDHGTDQTQATEGVFTGVEIYYRSSLYRDDRPHPEHLTHLVLIDGIDKPVIEEDCRFQTLDPNGGLTPDSLIGNPIHPFTVRKLADSAYPPSDATMIRPLVNELNVFREQMVQYRDAQTLRWMYNTDTLPADAVQKIVKAPIGGMIGVPQEAFVGEGAFKELPHGSMPRESFTSNDYIDNDIAQTTAIDASGAGVQGIGKQTATAEQRQQMNANARTDKERANLLKRYLKGVTKFSTLLQRYLPTQEAAEIVGMQPAQVWDVWRKQVPSALSFTALPDSALRVDQAVDRQAAQELYSFLANDPYCAKGRQKLLEKLLRKFHIDPTGIVAPPDPPRPEPPKLALSFKGEDLVGPQAPIVIEILQQQGIQVSAAAIQLSQQALAEAQQLAEAEQAQAGDPQHGGKLPPQESLSKHAADRTGGMQGTGAPAAMGAPGGQLM